VKRLFLPTLLLAALVAATLSVTSCEQGPNWDADQTAVHDAMNDWSAAVTRGDGEALWEMLSPDAQEIYRRELEAPKGVRQTVKLNKASLGPDSKMAEEEKDRVRKLLATLPDDPDKMTPKDYYIWRINPSLTPEGAQRTEALFAKSNVKEISIQGDNATVVLKNGNPDRYSWVRHKGVWKFDVKPSILRALEDARRREAEKQ